MAARAAGRFFSGLLIGAAVGATVALVLASRTEVAVSGQRTPSGPTPFEPANQVLARAHELLDEVRTQVRYAVEEGKRTAAVTQADLNKRFEEAKRGKQP